ncbi:UDP-glucose 6-dehydrogenase [Curtobacterium sp. MCJR17_055]|uniref:UDP-glucose dehydrogenase family protein n=1 Tax=unclassified Curtobacterium TaxID=257496 RepID=UPI000D9CF793|nr:MULTISPECIES: UDP-glucose/GDP-mannose dehydrogenase family protein [unclassified Curtobacterium]PYY35992.1 UDP-glucose 6-dehydrogenase [Curtobacterium sp. MCBD17_029]PYY54907.1 UDP-glucose 6-dehydrogenase [Curtobacterium sp. MCJR17_055]PYY61143.1 UDP-glucose 6-dehydrogenase [Curtobacterium sp. MCPF17_015]WIB35299.1 UDP-glucose/GDP-mannose dehydrogenase family protein [Curtobacterium sp. MCJR17_043]
MRISVIGCGYLGAVHAASMAKLGHDVVAVDVDPEKIERLAAGEAPFFEPGLPEILGEAIASGRIRFTTDMAEVAGAQVHFLAVGTPQGPTGAADLRYVDAAMASLTPFVSAGEFVVGKSTVPVGTAARLGADLTAAVPGATLVWNPEFLREGFAVQDTITPDRFVYGVPEGEDGQRAVAALDEVYATALADGTPRLVVDLATAELVKISANAFLATKISFINSMAEIAEVVGADVTALADAIGHDARIGRKFLNAGLGFGGGCLPKDIRAFQARADELGVGESLAFLADVDATNLRRRAHVVELAQELLGGAVAGKRIAVLGLAFKPNSDDVRDSPALDIAARLRDLGATVASYDPEAVVTARRVHPELDYAETATDALTGADLVLVLTEWNEFRELDPMAVAALVSSPVVVDGRNCLDREAWRAAGFTYRGMGR